MRHIYKQFPGVLANADVCLNVRAGEVHALLGENGAGKSTLMNQLCGLIKPTSGEIVIDGKEVHFNSARDAMAIGIGMVHQHFMLVPTMTVTENCLIGATDAGYLKLNFKQAAKRISELAEKYNLELRKSCEMQYFPVEELIHKVRTRDMACAYAENLSKVVAYLTAVMELANDVNNQLKVVIKNTKSIKHNSTLSKEEKTFEIAKSSVSSYVDILVEIKARIIDLENSDCNYNIQRTYTNLDTQVKTMMETTFIPDELAENFNMLYENYPLRKFSNAKDEGLSRTTTEDRFIDFSKRLYYAAIKLFIFELLE